MSGANIILILIVLILGYTETVNAQNGVTAVKGKVFGTVWDSSFTYELPSASVVILDSNSVMLEYTISDARGFFLFGGVPLNHRLYLFASYTGYTPIKREFVLTNLDSVIDFRHIKLQRSKSVELDEIIIKAIAPVRLNGDTLEFNASAFKMETNSVVEDLLRKLPGITMWGDGSITVNGRKVNSVTVDGKTFFGGDPKIALQNIDNKVVDKIQVYSQVGGPNTIDSILHMNIKLKENGKNGLFGKGTAGKGTDQVYEGGLTLNRYSPKLQLGIASSFNNVNKFASDINTLFRNSTYKGLGLDTEYYTDYNLPGKNNSSTIGYLLQNDRLKTPDYLRKDQIKSSYLYSRKFNETEQHSKRIYEDSRGELFSRTTLSNAEGKEEQHLFNINYNKGDQQQDFEIDMNFRGHSENYSNVDSTNIGNSTIDVLNRSLRYNHGKNLVGNIELRLKFDNLEKDFKRRRKGLRTENYFSMENQKKELEEHVSYNSIIDTTDKFILFRKSDNRLEKVRNDFSLAYNNLELLLFGKRNGIEGIEVGFDGRVNFEKTWVNSDIRNKYNLADEYLKNTYLSNRRSESIFEVIPALVLTKRIYNASANRFTKTTVFKVDLPINMRNEVSRSEKDFQNYDRKYSYFVPKAAVTYSYNQFGRNNQTLALTIENKINYPMLQQIAPLVDSASIYSLYEGNASLRPAREYECRIMYSFSDERKGNDFSLNFSGATGIIKNHITDSNLYDSEGRAVIFYTNASETASFFDLDANVNKAVKFNKLQVQVIVDTRSRFTKLPNYIDNAYDLANIYTTNNSLGMHLTYREFLLVRISENLVYQNTIQNSTRANNLFSRTSTLQVATSIVFHSFSFSTDYNWIQNRYRTSRENAFLIWNMSAKQRFLKKRNLEVKVCAFDLLKQNKSIRNFVSNTSLTSVSSNLIQNYYMLMISFYPRKFGNKK